MIKYLIAENLKTKKTILRKLLICIPMLCVSLALIFDFLGFGYFTSKSAFTSINHWSLSWMPLLVVFLTGMFHKIEQNSTGYKTIFSFPIDLKKSWIAKIAILSFFTLIASLFLGILTVILNIAFTSTEASVVPFYNCFIAIIISWITSLWQIPLCLWLSRKINFFILLILTYGANLELGASRAPSSLWWLFPWSIPLRLQCPLLHLHPNCLPLDSNSALLNSSVIPVGIVLSILLFFILVLITSYSFSKSEVC